MPLPEPPLREKDFLSKVWARWFQDIKTTLPSAGVIVSTTGIQTLTNKTLTSPVISNLTPLRVTYSDASKILQSISDLTAWIKGTTNRITVTDNLDGTMTITIPDTPQLAGLLLSSLTASRLMASNGTKNLMSVADLASWVAGTANQIIVTNDGDGTITLSLATFPKFSAHKNGTDQTSVATATPTKVTFTTEEYDVGSAYDAPNSKWIPGIIGKAHIDIYLEWTSSVDQKAHIVYIYKNGAAYKGGAINSSGTGYHYTTLSCNVLVDAVTDYFEVYAYQETGGNKTISGRVVHTWFMGHMLP